MLPAERPRKTIRFGPFEVDIAAAELRKQGLRIRLQEQPFAVLSALLEQPGEVVCREELIRRLWPDGTVVDFDRGINAAVTRLRQALLDSAETPRYVETVARRGYRFIGTVVADAPAAPVAPSESARRPPAKYLALAAAAIAFLAGSGLWLWRTSAPAADRDWTVVPLTTDPGSEVHASFSPDGRQVTYEWAKRDGKPHVYVKLVGPGDPIRLTSGDAPEFGPAWSPDGRHIAFLRQLDRDRGALIVTPALGGVDRTVAECVLPSESLVGNALRRLDWTADSKYAVISSAERVYGPERLLLISIETGEKRWLTDGGSLQFPAGDREPAVSPDGRTIAFIRGELTSSERIYLLPMTPDWRPAGKPRPLDSGVARNPAWTPDGKAILFKPYGDPGGGLAIIGIADGDKPRSLPALGTQLALPAIARIGRLAFSRGGSDGDIWRQEIVAGGNAPPAEDLIPSSANDSEARYSPDGARIVFSSDRSGHPDLWVCAGDGSHCSQITFFNKPFIVGSPRWSADGKRIAFDSAATGIFNVYMVDANGGAPKLLTGASFFGAIPSWSQDGKWVYFMSNRTGRPEVWKVSSGGGSPVQVTRNGGHTAVESSDGKALFYTKRENDATLFRSALDGSGEQEVLPHVAHRGFTFGKGVIYYLRAESADWTSLRRYSIANGDDTELARISGRLYLHLSVTPDEKYAIYTRFESRGSDLMLVDRFR